MRLSLLLAAILCAAFVAAPLVSAASSTSYSYSKSTSSSSGSSSSSSSSSSSGKSYSYSYSSTSDSAEKAHPEHTDELPDHPQRLPLPEEPFHDPLGNIHHPVQLPHSHEQQHNNRFQAQAQAQGQFQGQNGQAQFQAQFQGHNAPRRDVPNEEARKLDGNRAQFKRSYSSQSYHSSSSASSSSSFDLKPNTPGESGPIEVGGALCNFKYAAFGGTVEKWQIEAVQMNGFYKCTISRPQGRTYLVFSSFTASFSGVGKLSRVEIWDEQGIALEGDTYVIRGEEVSSTSKWDGPLYKIVLESNVD